ncbi:GerMN domain-containing protein [Micromonospora sp. WMMD1155]|uniref:GerMN domain-containing protein n=1 Tax=Micromonospora sp. WMMD1155 TaxID=3016094 RepID=UPI00249BAD62|nr:GerMN domain-containing protein [Micromonospora sp. WMMD1155]WFE53217.1 GerMN domain-containing protein [Micromonospora sp. WMMD1155]
MNRRHVVVVAFVALLAGCGIPAEDAPRTVQPPPGPFQGPTPSEASAPAGPATETLCLVRDNRIIPVPRRADRPATVQEQLRDLLGGPTTAERDKNLTSALPGAVNAAGVTVTGTQAQVVVDEPGSDAGRSDEILAFGQIVCTLTNRDDVTSVTFLRDGKPLAVPRADGSLSNQALVRADYITLISPR